MSIISSSDCSDLTGLDLVSSAIESIVELEGIAGSPAIPQYRMSFKSVFVNPSLPIFQDDEVEGRGLMKLTHSQFNGSEQ